MYNYTEIKDMLTPTVLKVQSDYLCHSRIVLEPLEPGYGYTLGNALRRILMSSMIGCAITEVSIDGVLHEYSTIEGVEEDAMPPIVVVVAALLPEHKELRALGFHRDLDNLWLLHRARDLAAVGRLILRTRAATDDKPSLGERLLGRRDAEPEHV